MPRDFARDRAPFERLYRKLMANLQPKRRLIVDLHVHMLESRNADPSLCAYRRAPFFSSLKNERVHRRCYQTRYAIFE